MPRLALIIVGTFGSDVADLLSARHPGSERIVADAGTHLSAWPALDALVVLADHDHAVLMEMAERAAYAWRRPWLPVLLESAHLRCGPVVVPGTSACHRCFRRRRRQHALDPSVWADQPAEAVLGDRIRGYARHHVTIAAALATQAISEAFDPSPRYPGGWVRTVGLADGSLHRAGVVPIDGCDRCRDPRARADRPDRLVAALQEALGAETSPLPSPQRGPAGASPSALTGPAGAARPTVERSVPVAVGR